MTDHDIDMANAMLASYVRLIPSLLAETESVFSLVFRVTGKFVF